MSYHCASRLKTLQWIPISQSINATVPEWPTKPSRLVHPPTPITSDSYPVIFPTAHSLASFLFEQVRLLPLQSLAHIIPLPKLFPRCVPAPFPHFIKILAHVSPSRDLSDYPHETAPHQYSVLALASFS